MEESAPQQTQDLEYPGPTEEQGGIRRRLRDRELLKKRKAEAEEKETNQWLFGEESPRKRARAETKGRRGRPRKAEIRPAPDAAVLAEGAPAVVVLVPAPQEALTSSGTDAQGSRPADLPEQGPVLSDLLVPSQVVATAAFDSPPVAAPAIPIRPDLVPIAAVPVDSTPTLAPLLVVASSTAADSDPVIQVAQELDNRTPTLATPSVVAPVGPDPVAVDPTSLLPSTVSTSETLNPQESLVVSDDSAVTRADAAPPSTVPSLEVTISITPQNPVVIEDEGPDETEDFPQSQEDEGVMPLNSTTEQNQKFLTQSSALPQQQEYPNGN
ncbi:hemogen [Synchiropus splendidus]|uniref:hemogen n=1 Tax=Synchiropus splendidus TaxID=270530 RepID=UPI00237EE593|nr:hemogen [Synchiropus splendidus]